MQKQIISFFDGLKKDKKINKFDENSTKQAIVMRILSMLEWDIFNVDEVVQNYTSKSNAVDYALKIKNTNKVFIVVKGASEELEEYQKELLGFAYNENIELSILTNGIIWWFYLSSKKGSWKQKRFFTANLLKQVPKDIAPMFIEYLTKKNIASGSSLKSAETTFKVQQQMVANYTVPEAWNNIVTEPSSMLVELLNDTTEKICGYKPDKDLIIRFLKEHENEWKVEETPVMSEMADMEEEPEDEEMINEEEEPAPPKPKPKPKKSKPRVRKVFTPETKTSGNEDSEDIVEISEGAIEYEEQEEADEAEEDSSMDQIDDSMNYDDKSILAFSFKDEDYEVSEWSEMLVKLCELISAEHEEDFDKVLWLSGKGRSYFSKDDEDLREPEKIKKTPLYVDVKITPNAMIKLIDDIIKAFGYSDSDFVILAE